MPPVLFLCDGASAPKAWSNNDWKAIHYLQHRGREPEVNLRIENLSHRLLSQLGSREADLVRIASYVYIADQWVSRGGIADVYNRQWRRQMAMAIPVEGPQFWSDPIISALLSSVLNFLTDDSWQFRFCPKEGEQEQLVFDLRSEALFGSPDCVISFSGGADSLCAAVEAVAENNKSVLVSHKPAPNVGARQDDLVNMLRERMASWGMPCIGARIHCRRTQARDTSQRTRAFLYASNAACVASHLGIQEVLLADNGVVSLNLPVNDQLIGALASRGTHPKFLRLFNAFIANVLATPVRVRNPFWNRTRAEVLEILKGTGNEELLQETISCSRSRGRSIDKPQCGYCYQCVDRRFGAIAAGLEEHDLTEQYGLDIFTEELPEGEPRIVATSYARFATHVSQLEDSRFITELPELYDCIDHQRHDADQQATEFIAMLKRHGLAVLDALQSQLVRYARSLTERELPEHCLLRLHLGSREPGQVTVTEVDRSSQGEGAADFVFSPDYRSVTFRGQQFTLTAMQAAVVAVLHEQYCNGTPDVGDAYILETIGLRSSRLADIFKRCPAWKTLVIAGRKGTHRLALST